MTPLENPALSAFITAIGEGMVFGQIRIQPFSKGWELRHVDDVDSASLALKPIAVLRELAQTSAAGAFRPLRSAPNLITGWRAIAISARELEDAMHQIYPGAIADWYAAQHANPPVTHYREFTNRQTGMYRITQLLSDTQVTRVIRAHCPARFCLKQRLWTVQGQPTDHPGPKSLIPCLEPCPMLLEFARLAMRIEQEEKVNIELSPPDLETVRTALEAALAHPIPNLREADFASPLNPRRIQLALEKLPTSNTSAAEANQASSASAD